MNKFLRTALALSIALMTTLSIYTSASAESTTTTTTTTQTVVQQAAATDISNEVITAKITLGDTITVSGLGATASGSVLTINAGGTYSISGELSNGQIIVDTTENVKLILNGVSVTNATGSALLAKNAQALNIYLADGTTNTLTDGDSYNTNLAALYSNSSITIDGTGALNVTGNKADGIYSNNDITINNGTVRITADEDAINANDITVNSGYVYAAGSFEGIYSDGTVSIKGGKVIALGTDYHINEGYTATGKLSITGGTFLSTDNTFAEVDSSSKQSIINFTSGSYQASGTLLNIKDKSENEVLTYAPERAWKNLTYSSDKLTSGASYKAYLGGSSDGKEVDGLYAAGSAITGASAGEYTVTAK